MQPERYVKRLGANVTEEQLQREAEWDGTNSLDALSEQLRLRNVAAIDNQPFRLTQDVLEMLE